MTQGATRNAINCELYWLSSQSFYTACNFEVKADKNNCSNKEGEIKQKKKTHEG